MHARRMQSAWFSSTAAEELRARALSSSPSHCTRYPSFAPSTAHWCSRSRDSTISLGADRGSGEGGGQATVRLDTFARPRATATLGLRARPGRGRVGLGDEKSGQAWGSAQSLATSVGANEDEDFGGAHVRYVLIVLEVDILADRELFIALEHLVVLPSDCGSATYAWRPGPPHRRRRRPLPLSSSCAARHRAARPRRRPQQALTPRSPLPPPLSSRATTLRRFFAGSARNLALSAFVHHHRPPPALGAGSSGRRVPRGRKPPSGTGRHRPARADSSSFDRSEP